MLLPKKKFYIFKAGQELPYWLSAWTTNAESPAKTRELSFKNRHAKITFIVSCTIKITPSFAIINTVKGSSVSDGVILIKGLSSANIIGVKGISLTPNINPHLGKPIKYTDLYKT